MRPAVRSVAAALLLCADLFAQNAPEIPRTPDGHPDLQGFWTNGTITPLLRPAEFENKEFLTPQEAAEFERTALPRLLQGAQVDQQPVEVSYTYIDRLALADGGRTSLIVDPANGRFPPRAPPFEGRDAVSSDGPETRTPDERCLLGMAAGSSSASPPIVPNPINGNFYQIVQTPDYVMIAIDGETRTELRRVLTVAIGPGYFRTFRLALLRGREFVNRDGTDGQAHAIINERAAQLFFGGGQHAIGQRIAFTAPDAGGAPLEWLTVVGVAPDIRQRPRPVPDTEPIVYVPYRTLKLETATLLLRGNVDVEALAPAVRTLLLELDPNVPLYRVRTMAGVIEDAGWNARVSNVLIRVLALIAVTVATVGLYAVTAHGVYQRTPELGLRMALGARQWQIAGLIFRRAGAQVAVGFIVGVLCTVVWARLFWTDAERGLMPIQSLAVVAAVIVVLALAASLVPTLRATRLDPVAALRHE
jgi:FtsX-like permease family protein/MacB-like protein